MRDQGAGGERGGRELSGSSTTRRAEVELGESTSGAGGWAGIRSDDRESGAGGKVSRHREYQQAARRCESTSRRRQERARAHQRIAPDRERTRLQKHQRSKRSKVAVGECLTECMEGADGDGRLVQIW